MSKQALDKMVLIADAFDQGAFAGMDRVDTNTVAQTVGLPPKAVARYLARLWDPKQRVGVRLLSKSKTVKQRHDRVYEYPPRIHLPNLAKIRQPEARLVVEAITDHRLPRSFTAAVLYHRLGIPANGGTIRQQGHLPQKLHKALLGHGFTSHRPPGFKEKAIWQPAIWEPPQDREAWPKLFLEQRRLLRNGVRESTIGSHTDAAAKLDGIIHMALEQLDLSRVPYDQRGAVIGAIRNVIRQGFHALLASENEAARATRKPTVNPEVDWQSVLALTDSQLRDFARLMARLSGSERFPNLGAYALRRVLGDSPGAATDGVAVHTKSNEHASAV